MKHDWKGDGCDTHKGEYWYRCENCGKRDWISFNGTLEDLTKEPCTKPKTKEESK